MTTISLRIDEQDAELVRKFARFNGLSISDFTRKAVLEKIEDEIDLKELR